MPPDTARLIFVASSTAGARGGRASSARQPMLQHAPQPAPQTDSAVTQQCRDVLSQVLRQTVIARLRLAHRNDGAAGPHASRPVASAASSTTPTRTARHAARAAIRCADLEQADPLDAFVETLRWEAQDEVDRSAAYLAGDDMGLAHMLLDFAPAVECRLAEIGKRARDQGARPAADLLLAEWRLHELVERLAMRFHAEAPAAAHRGRAVLGTAEAATHRIRLQIAGEALHGDGWDVWSEAESGLAELVETVRCDRFALAVIAADATPVEGLSRTIQAMRRASLNPALRVMVMSAALCRRPDRMVRLGADAAGGDIRQTLVQARRVLTLPALRR